MKKEEIYVNLQGKTKEELTDLYWLLKNNNEEILNNELDIFIMCYLNIENRDYKFHFCSEVWSCAGSNMISSKQEITIEQLKEIIKPMETFKPIAMKCNQEQFEAIKPKLKGCDFADEKHFYDSLLSNNVQGNINHIGFVVSDSDFMKERKIHEKWNEELFLKACGIKVECLEQQLQKAEAEVKRLQSLIEEENKIKNLYADYCRENPKEEVVYKHFKAGYDSRSTKN